MLVGDADPIAALTDKQRQCLRMVLTHHSSKEIARELGIGVDAVDQRIKGAMRRLGVNSRLEAARMLAQQEGWPATELAHVVLQRAEARSRLARIAGRLLHLLPKNRRRRFALWASLASFLIGLIDAGAPVDDLLRDWNNRYHRNSASGDIVYVAIDERSIKGLGPTPWPRDRLARLVDRLSDLEAERVAVGFLLNRRTDLHQDRTLARSFERFDDRLTLVADGPWDPDTGIELILPLPEFRNRANLSHGYAINRLWAARRIPFHMKLAGRTYTSLSAELVAQHRAPATLTWAGRFVALLRNDDSFPIDYSIDPGTIPMISAVDLLNRRVAPDLLAKKSVLLVGAHPARATIPGYGKFPGDVVGILGAETLKAGPPLEVAWPIPLFAAMLVVALCAIIAKPLFTIPAMTGGGALLLVLLRILDAQMIFLHASPALFLLLIVGTGFAWISLKEARRTRAADEAAGASG